MKLILKAGSTSNILQLFVPDSSSSTGAGLTGLAFNTGSLTCYYHKDIDTTATVVTLNTMTVGTYTSAGFKEIDATNMPGWYQLCIPNAAVSSGKNVGIHLKGATNMAPVPLEIQLVSYDPYDVSALGLSNIDATISSRSTYAGGAVASVTGNVGGNVIGSVGSVVGAVGSVTGAVGSVTGSVGSVTGNVGGNVVGSVASVVGAVGSVTAGVTVTTNSDKTGYSLTVTPPTAAQTATATLTLASGVETGWTLQEALRIILSSASAILSGAATTTVTIRDVLDTKNRIVATVDANGNRTAVTFDKT